MKADKRAFKVGKHSSYVGFGRIPSKNFYEYSIKNHFFFQRENKEDLMENKRTETTKQYRKVLEPNVETLSI